MKEDLFGKLKSYSESDYYPFHMPGHKRNMQSGPLAELYRYDITEIDGFDNLHHPAGIIKAAQEKAAKLYGAQKTYFLINGSTAGILSAVSALAGQGKKLLIARNCHKAVYHAAFLNRLELCYVYPRQIRDYDIAGQIELEDIKTVLQNVVKGQDVKNRNVRDVVAGVVITSPTYDGIVSDISAIAGYLHQFEIPLIVDQAHGAHFGLHPAYPENAVRQGADLVIHSAHKTLPAPTQTALLHYKGNLVDRCRLERYLRIYQSSSPSYILMSGLESALEIASKEGYDRLCQLLGWRNWLSAELKNCRFIRVCPLTEPGKLVISAPKASITGRELYDILRQKYHLQMEMAQGKSVTGILSMMDKEEGFLRLRSALCEIDSQLQASGREGSDVDSLNHLMFPERRIPLWQAYDAPDKEVEIEKAEGQIAAEFIDIYPPGVPLLVPGECLSAEILQAVSFFHRAGYQIEGIHNHKIRVVYPFI